MSTRIEVGSSSVKLQFNISSGATGETPFVRLIEPGGDFFDFNDNTFKAAGHVEKDKTLAEVDATDAAGLYEFLWNHTLASPTIASGDEITAKFFRSVGGQTITEIFRFQVQKAIQTTTALIFGLLNDRMAINNSTNKLEQFNASDVVTQRWAMKNPAGLVQNADTSSISERGQPEI